MLRPHEFHYETRLLSNSGKGVAGNRENGVEIIIPCFNNEPSFVWQFALAPGAAERRGSRREEVLTKPLCTVTFPADAAGGVGGRETSPSPGPHLHFRSQPRFYPYVFAIRSFTGGKRKQNENIPAIQKLVAVFSPIKLISSAAVCNHNNCLKTVIILGAVCGCQK